MEGVEIVIKPIHLERAVYVLIIIALAVLLVIKWNAAAHCTPEIQSESGSQAGASPASGSSLANQTANLTVEMDLCANSVRDQDETDIDCGGSKCEKCPDTKFCITDSDCESGYCHMGIRCQTPTCSDGIKNKDETNIDCGGHCKDTKGEFYYDGECHKEPKPVYSGKVNLTITKVDVSANDVSGYARVDNVTFKITNEKSANLRLTAYVYLRRYSGTAYFTNSAGNEVAKAFDTIPVLDLGESYTKTIPVGVTLPETELTTKFRVVVDVRDDDDKLINSVEWINNR